MVSLVHGGTELPARAIDVTYLRQRRRLLKQQAELWQMNTAIVGCLCLLSVSRHSAVVGAVTTKKMVVAGSTAQSLVLRWARMRRSQESALMLLLAVPCTW